MLPPGPSSIRQRVVIIGGGFGGLYAAQSLRRVLVDVTLVDRRNFHLFQPLLYQVATGGLSPANIAAPLRGVLNRQRNVQVLLAEACGFDLRRGRVLLRDGELAYDTLIVAAGSTNHYFGHDAWEALAPGLKSVEDATRIRARVLYAFEASERCAGHAETAGWLTFVVVGAGPTGVELAGALAEIARDTLRHDFRRSDPTRARIILIDTVERVLPAYPPNLSQRAAESLARLGVQVRTGTRVVDLFPCGLELESAGQRERLAARTVLWAAGVRAAPLGELLTAAGGAPLDRMGRVLVRPDLTVPGYPNVFVIGDLAHCAQDGEPLPGVAPVAMQQGRYVARLIAARLRGAALPPFRYHDRGRMATIGRAAAVAELRGLRLWGYPAWLTWLFVHLMYLVEFQNRVRV
ncbi:MAG: NAD(P)/FAD-dependent oxidoreductase, partial [Planctomycetota bacterium]